jgi:periplasmic protein TonB
MTIAADGFARDPAELKRWGASLVLVLLVHVGAGLYLLSRQMPLDAAGGAPPDTVMIDLAPLPAPTPPAPAPPIPIPEPAPEPQLQPIVPPPPLSPPLDIPLRKLEPSPAPKPAVVLPKPPPKVTQKPLERPPEVMPDRPPPAAPVATAPPAPVTAPPAVATGAARASWQAQLVGWLERYKRYPRLAQEQRQEGIVHLRFTMDRAGHVLAAQIDKGSGFALLDEEVSALIQRAQPLPAPPPEVPGAQITLTLPVEFSLHGDRR